MTDYRIYILDLDGRQVICSASLECASDADAKSRAEEFAKTHDVVWLDGRMIMRFDHKAPTLPLS
jgi:hypothetical protein